MKKLSISTMIIVIFFIGIKPLFADNPFKNQPFISITKPVPTEIKEKIKKYTWHEGCPIKVKDLIFMHLSYWGYDNEGHLGTIIVHKDAAKEVREIFKLLYKERFPIELMHTMSFFKGNEFAALKANNTSGFNCRYVTGYPGIFTQSSFGRSVTINPLVNPYVQGETVIPSRGKTHQSRDFHYKGKITPKSKIYKIFKRYGWDWGGDWFDVQEYGLFEKRPHGQRRDPFGYERPDEETTQ